MKTHNTMILGLAVLFAGSAAQADLGTYKKAKMENRTEVTSENCQQQYLARCAGQAGCTNEAAQQACAERDSRHTKKTWEIIGKAASVGAGAAAVAIDKPMQTVYTDANGVELSPYAIVWNRSSFMMQLGGGLIESGANIASATAHYRSASNFGFGVNADYLWDQTTKMGEVDLGPSYSIASSSFMYSFQPSLMISTATDERPIYGAGLRSYTQYVNNQFFAFFNPLLGYTNSKWAYDLKVGAGYRFSPTFFADLSYSYRDVVDFKDFDITAAALSGAMVQIGYRMN